MKYINIISCYLCNMNMTLLVEFFTQLANLSLARSESDSQSQKSSRTSRERGQDKSNSLCFQVGHVMMEKFSLYGIC